MNIIICDDDLHFLEDLSNKISNFFQTKDIDPIIYKFTSGIDFQKWYKKKKGKIDFLFMDLELPHVGGLDILKSFKNSNSNSIIYIVSSHSELVFDSFEISPFQYLVKPLSFALFTHSLERGYKKYKLLNQKFILNYHNKHYVLNYDDIILIESYRSTTTVYSTLGNFKTSTKISEFEKLLIPNGSFLKCHKSFIINMNKVIYYEKNNFILENNNKADISDRKRASIIEAFENYILCCS